LQKRPNQPLPGPPHGGTGAHSVADPAQRRALSNMAVCTRSAVVARPAVTPRWARCTATCTLSTGAVGRTHRARSCPQEFSGDAGRHGGWRKCTGAVVVWSPAAPRQPRWPEAGSLSSHVLERMCRAASWRRGRFGEAGRQKEVAWHHGGSVVALTEEADAAVGMTWTAPAAR
jgi:hypothetical protein